MRTDKSRELHALSQRWWKTHFYTGTKSLPMCRTRTLSPPALASEEVWVGFLGAWSWDFSFRLQGIIRSNRRRVLWRMPLGLSTTKMAWRSLGESMGCVDETPALYHMTEQTRLLKSLFVWWDLRPGDSAPSLKSALWPWTLARSPVAFLDPVSPPHPSFGGKNNILTGWHWAKWTILHEDFSMNFLNVG